MPDPTTLPDQPIGAFLEALASDAPTPGGGAAAALAGALGAAAMQMAANLTAGHPKFAEVDTQARQVAADAAEHRRALLALAEADAAAFASVSAAYRLPKATDPEREARSARIQQALVAAAEVPLRVAQVCAALLEVAERAAPILNPAVISDVLVGAVLAHGALESAALNVEINLNTMADQAEARHIAGRLAEARSGAGTRLERALAIGRARMPRKAT